MRIKARPADVRCGSKTEKLNASKCFPLCPGKRTLRDAVGMSASCHHRKSVDFSITSSSGAGRRGRSARKNGPVSGPAKSSWLGELENVSVGLGVLLL